MLSVNLSKAATVHNPPSINTYPIITKFAPKKGLQDILTDGEWGRLWQYSEGKEDRVEAGIRWTRGGSA